jgi:hypothetical protein
MLQVLPDDFREVSSMLHRRAVRRLKFEHRNWHGRTGPTANSNSELGAGCSGGNDDKNEG